MEGRDGIRDRLRRHQRQPRMPRNGRPRRQRRHLHPVRRRDLRRRTQGAVRPDLRGLHGTVANGRTALALPSRGRARTQQHETRTTPQRRRRRYAHRDKAKGRFIVVASSGGRCHETGQPWVRELGAFATVATVTAKNAPTSTASRRRSTRCHHRRHGGPRPRAHNGDRPGDQYNASTTWADVLGRAAGSASTKGRRNRVATARQEARHQRDDEPQRDRHAQGVLARRPCCRPTARSTNSAPSRTSNTAGTSPPRHAQSPPHPDRKQVCTAVAQVGEGASVTM